MNFEDMTVVKGYPPNIGEIRARFGEKAIEDAVLTYGTQIYSPGTLSLPGHLMRHERVHSRQQGANPALWWERYLKDAEFRMEQELEAYREQYDFFSDVQKDRNIVAKFLHKLCLDLSGPMYGRCIDYRTARMKLQTTIQKSEEDILS